MLDGSLRYGSDWYGAEANVDAWLGAVDEQLRKQSR